MSFTNAPCKEDIVSMATMVFYGCISIKLPAKRGDKFREHRFMAQFWEIHVLVPVPISEFVPSNPTSHATSAGENPSLAVAHAMDKAEQICGQHWIK